MSLRFLTCLLLLALVLVYPRLALAALQPSPSPVFLTTRAVLPIGLDSGACRLTTYTYDAMDRLATRKDALNRTESYGYDLNGNLNVFTGASGRWGQWKMGSGMSIDL